MLKQIELNNFKCFKGVNRFPFANINLLTGINGKGKSSLLQSLLLIKQSLEYDQNTCQIILNGSNVRLGTFSDVHNSDTANTEPIVMKFIWQEEDLELNLNYRLGENIEDEDVLDIKNVKISTTAEFKNLQQNFTTQTIELTKTNEGYTESWIDANKQFPLFSKNVLQRFAFLKLQLDTEDVKDVYSLFSFNKVHYVAADRIGPQDFYLKSVLGNFTNVGSRGENTANILTKERDTLVNDKLYLGKDAQTLITQTAEWLSKIFGGANIDAKRLGSTNIIELYLSANSTAPAYKPANVGFGYSYVLPIIVSGLIAKSGEILIVENPEAHLHPSAQSKLAEFLAIVSSCGIQVFIESHSEHILNGLRVATLNPDIELESSNVNVLYFQDNLDSPCVHIPINPDGSIDKWPNGFFDQTDKDYKILFGF